MGQGKRAFSTRDTGLLSPRGWGLPGKRLAVPTYSYQTILTRAQPTVRTSLLLSEGRCKRTGNPSLGTGLTLSPASASQSGLTDQGPSLARAPRLTKASVGLAGEKATSPYRRPWCQ